jgi:hypothetical protein
VGAPQGARWRWNKRRATTTGANQSLRSLPRNSCKTDRIDAKLTASFMAFRPEAGRALPTEKLQILRTLTTRRAQLIGMRKRLVLQISSRTRQAIPAQVDSMDDDLKALFNAQLSNLKAGPSALSPGEKLSPTRQCGYAPFLVSDRYLQLC